MNGVVKRDFVRRLSRNLTNMELGLSDAEEYAYYDAASYDHHRRDEGPPSYADRAEKRKRRGEPANYDCIRQRNRALGVVRDTNGRTETTTTTIGTNGTTPPVPQGKPKRRKAAPSLGRTVIPSRLDTEPHCIESPYFSRGQRPVCRRGSKCFRREPNHCQRFYHPASRREEKYDDGDDDDDDDDDVIFLFEKQARRRPGSNRSLGKEAATQYPATGMLDSTTSISDWRKGPGDDDDEDDGGGGGGGAWSAVGVGLGQSSFEVKQLRDQADDIPREDGTMYDEDPNPFSAEWQDREFNKQKILEKDPDYQFITLLSGFTNTPVVRLYDEARLEDIVVRRLDVQRQMGRIRALEEMRLRRVPQLEQEAARLQSTLERAEGSLRLLERNRDSIRAAKRIMRRAREAREIITEADESEATLRTAKQLVMGFTEHAGDAAWIGKITDPRFLIKAFPQIQRCARFLIPLGKFRTEAIVRTGAPRTKIDVVETMQETIIGDLSVSDMAVARSAFVCMAYLVALILDSQEFQEDPPPFRSTEPTAVPGGGGRLTAMELWESIVLRRTDQNTGVLLVVDPNPPPDLAQPDAEDLRAVMEDLRSIWIYWSPLPSAAERSRVSGHKADSDTLDLMNQVFRRMLEEFQGRARQASEDLIEIQEGIRDTASAIEDLTRARDPLPTTLSAWEDALRTWVEGVEAGARLSETQRRVMFERLQKLTTTLREMEIITPPRVKYQRRREWALRPEHSGRVPLDSTVVSGIQAAVDTMTDVGRVLHGARSDHMRNVLTAGVDNLQRDRLSRGAFAKLVASRMAMQQEMFPTRWTRKEHLHRIRLQTASALRSLTNLRWTGSKFVDRTRDTLALERALMTRIFSRWPPA